MMNTHTSPGQGLATKPVILCVATALIGIMITLLWVAHYRQSRTPAPRLIHQPLSPPNNETALTLMHQLDQEKDAARHFTAPHIHSRTPTTDASQVAWRMKPLPGANAPMMVVNNYPGPTPWESSAKPAMGNNSASNTSSSQQHHHHKTLAPHHTLATGTFIPARLVTGTRSDTPGPLVATVVTPLYDSATGSHCLIPAGATLIGENINTDNRTTLKTRWTQLIINHHTLTLPTNTALSREEKPGLGAKIHHHPFARVGQALWQIAINNAPALMTPLYTRSHNTDSQAPLFNASANNDSAWQIPVTQALQALNAPMRLSTPTTSLEAPAGLPFYVVLTEPLSFPQHGEHQTC